MKTIKVGMIGFGTIGAGVAKILAENSEIIKKRLGAGVDLVKVADLDITTDRGIKLAPNVDRKSTRLNSSHKPISYAVFCLKKKTHPRL